MKTSTHIGSLHFLILLLLSRSILFDYRLSQCAQDLLVEVLINPFRTPYPCHFTPPLYLFIVGAELGTNERDRDRRGKRWIRVSKWFILVVSFLVLLQDRRMEEIYIRNTLSIWTKIDTVIWVNYSHSSTSFDWMGKDDWSRTDME